jgi:para-aminobenzoate synthetase component 1
MESDFYVMAQVLPINLDTFYVDTIRELIAQGWVYQVNACRQICAEDYQPKFARTFFTYLGKQLLRHGRVISKIPGINIASASPELFQAHRRVA